jgi:hypothetical protein
MDNAVVAGTAGDQGQRREAQQQAKHPHILPLLGAAAPGGGGGQKPKKPAPYSPIAGAPRFCRSILSVNHGKRKGKILFFMHLPSRACFEATFCLTMRLSGG